MVKVTLCDRCDAQTKSPHDMDGFDLCVDCWALWQDKYKDVRERFMTKPGGSLLSGILPTISKPVLMLGVGAVIAILVILVVFRI